MTKKISARLGKRIKLLPNLHYIYIIYTRKSSRTTQDCLNSRRQHCSWCTEMERIKKQNIIAAKQHYYMTMHESQQIPIFPDLSFEQHKFDQIVLKVWSFCVCSSFGSMSVPRLAPGTTDNSDEKLSRSFYPSSNWSFFYSCCFVFFATFNICFTLWMPSLHHAIDTMLCMTPRSTCLQWNIFLCHFFLCFILFNFKRLCNFFRTDFSFVSFAHNEFGSSV